MRLDEIGPRLSANGVYSAQLDDGILRIRNLELGSEYILEAFERSAQIRQAVWFECHELPEDDLNRLYVLCSMMNARFSGCKSYIDQWGVLITAADILDPGVATDSVETILGQVEFVSQATLDLVEMLHSERRLVTDEEINRALDVPPLH